MFASVFLFCLFPNGNAVRLLSVVYVVVRISSSATYEISYDEIVYGTFKITNSRKKLTLFNLLCGQH